jgi:hypothetical protein
MHILIKKKEHMLVRLQDLLNYAGRPAYVQYVNHVPQHVENENWNDRTVLPHAQQLNKFFSLK